MHGDEAEKPLLDGTVSSYGAIPVGGGGAAAGSGAVAAEAAGGAPSDDLADIVNSFQPQEKRFLDSILGALAAGKGAVGLGSAIVALINSRDPDFPLPAKVTLAVLGTLVSELGSFPFYKKSSTEGRQVLLRWRDYLAKKAATAVSVSGKSKALLALGVVSYVLSQAGSVAGAGMFAGLTDCGPRTPLSIAAALLVLAGNIPAAIKNVPIGLRAFNVGFTREELWMLLGKGPERPGSPLRSKRSTLAKVAKGGFAFSGSAVNYVNTVSLLMAIASAVSVSDRRILYGILAIGLALGIPALWTPVGMNYEGIEQFMDAVKEAGGVWSFLKKNIGGFFIALVTNTGPSAYLATQACLALVDHLNQELEWGLDPAYISALTSIFITLGVTSCLASTSNKMLPAQEYYFAERCRSGAVAPAAPEAANLAGPAGSVAVPVVATTGAAAGASEPALVGAGDTSIATDPARSGFVDRGILAAAAAGAGAEEKKSAAAEAILFGTAASAAPKFAGPAAGAGL